MRNLLLCVPNCSQSRVGTLVRPMADQLRARLPRASVLMDDAEAGVSAYFAFPQARIKGRCCDAARGGAGLLPVSILIRTRWTSRRRSALQNRMPAIPSVARFCFFHTVAGGDRRQ